MIIDTAGGLRLGLDLCIPHQCQCGSPVDARGLHSFVCRRAPGRSARHHTLNDLVARCFASAGTPATKEPTGLFRTDGKRPDGLTLVLWQSGKSLCWDVTVICPLAESYVTGYARRPRSRCCSGTRRFSQRGKICQHWKRIPLCAHRGRNLRPNEHVGTRTLCQSGKKDLLGVRRLQRRSSFSVPESFGAGAARTTLYCYTTPCQPLTARTDDLYPILYYLNF